MTERDTDGAHGLPVPPLIQASVPDGLPVAGTPAEAEHLANEPGAKSLGRQADSPIGIAWPGWRVVIRRTAIEMLTDRVALVAAGCAFYGTLALFPAMSMLISIYGLAFDPQTVVPQLLVLHNLLPPAAFQLIAERLDMLVRNPPGTLTFHLLTSTAIAFWSSAAGTKSVIAALNLAYEERETRGFLRYNATAFIITLCVMVGTAAGLAFLVALPAALHVLGIQGTQRTLLRVIAFAVLVGAVLAGLSLLYRYGPARRIAQWRWVTAGSMVATVIWVAVSALFSYYVATFATYDATYGPLGTVVVVMMWFYVTAYAVLLGAELNAELELQTVRDSTEGPARPLGTRGAYVADHVAAESRR